MNKTKLICTLTVLMLAFSLSGAAVGENAGERVVVWKVTGARINTDELLSITFASPDGTMPAVTAEITERGGYPDGYWELKGQDGTPFCSVGPGYAGEVQNGFYINRQPDDSPYLYLSSLDSENTIPEESGFQDPRADETVRAAMDVMTRLGLNTEQWKAEPVYFSTLGRMAGTTKSRKVVLEETLEGLPVRWSGDSLYDKRKGISLASRCGATLSFSDEEGLVTASGDWCAFEPLTSAADVLPYNQVVEVFALAGYQDPVPEACP